MNNTFETTPEIRKYAPIILEEIKKAKSILLHCHPSPDPDSVGSALAMKFALEQLGKKVTVIKGDSDIPQAFMHFPGAKEIVQKNFFEVDLKEFDLFIIQDSGSIEMVSNKNKITFPESLNTVVIDHHPTNTKYGSINLVEASYPSTTQVLYDLFKVWRIKLNVNIASNLFIGTYTDTGGFKFGKTAHQTFEMAGVLTSIVPDFHQIISMMEDSNTAGSVRFKALALSSVETFLGDRLAISSVSRESLDRENILPDEISTHYAASALKSVIGWDVDVSLIEREVGKVKASFRTRDDKKFDVSRIAVAFGGGGHKAAGGATLEMSLEDAKKTVVSKAKELYNL